ncbi:MAG: hypothetical protein ACOVLC_15065 [Flavobacterium sp.]
MNNIKNVSVSEALKKGLFWLSVPGYILMFLFLLLFPAILIYVFHGDENSIYLAIGGVSSIFLGILLPMTWYFWMVVKYKIWAAKNVKDIHRFYNDVVAKKIINESSFFKKLEIVTKSQKPELYRFYKRLSSEKTLVRDPNPKIESETLINQEYKIYFFIFIPVLIYFSYQFIVIKDEQITYIILSAALIIYGFYKKFRYKFVIKVNRDFISYKNDELKIEWKDIIKYEVNMNHGVYTGIYNVKFYLDIQTQEKKHHLYLEGLSKKSTNKLIDVLNENKYRFDLKNQSM